jgi:ABC-2 type transport system permease protein
MVAVYAAFWFALGVLVNSWGRSSASNAVALAGLWLTMVLVWPALINAAATAAYPVPSRVEMVQAMRRAATTAEAKSGDLLAKYYNDHPELAPAENADRDEFFARSVAVQAESDRAVRPVLERFEGQLRAQQALVGRFRFLSPAILAQSALDDISGTSADRYRHFQRLADGFHQRWREFFEPRILRQETLGLDDYDVIPQFAFTEESSGEVGRRLAAALVGLLVPTLLSGLWAFLRLRRYSPVYGPQF